MPRLRLMAFPRAFTVMVKLNDMDMKGQSLMELLIAVALAVVVIASALRLMQFLTRSSAYDPVAQTGTFLAVDLMDSAAATAAGAWPAIASANPALHYHLTAGGAGFTLAGGDEPIKIVNGIAYTRYFTVSPVFRDGNDAIASVGANDLSTKKITAVVSWTYEGKPYNHTVEQYVARTQNEVSRQTDWVGGPICPGDDSEIKANAVNNRFCTSTLTGVDYTGKPGSIKIQGY